MINIDMADLERRVVSSYAKELNAQDPRDPYKILYSKVKGVPVESVTQEQRNQAKRWYYEAYRP